MFALFVMVVIVVGVIATLGVTLLSFQRTAEMTSLVQRNAARMEVVSVIMRSGARPVLAGGPLRAPVGPVVDAGEAQGRMTLPTGLVGDNRTPWGAYYGYCPAVLPGSPVDDANGAHQVDVNGETALARTLAGRDYIVSGPELPTEVEDAGLGATILGFVVSPTPNRFVLPDCGEIIYRDGAFLIGTTSGDAPSAGGTVIPILADANSLSFMASEIEPALYVSASASAGATGASPSEAMSLDDALAYWQAAKPRRLTLSLSGAFTLDDDVAFLTTQSNAVSNMAGRFLRITDASPTSASGGASISSTSGVWIAFGSDAVVEGVALGDSIGIRALPGSDVLIAASTVGRLRVDGGTIALRSDSRIVHGSAWGATSPIEIGSGSLEIVQASTGDSLLIASDASSVPAIRATGGLVSIAADVSAPTSALPWSLAGTASFDVGQKSFSAGTPNITYASGTVAATPTAAASVGSISNGVAVATCPALHPHLVAGGCSTSSGVLATTRPTSNGSALTGWECGWSALATVPPMPLPADGTATATCSVAPAP